MTRTERASVERMKGQIEELLYHSEGFCVFVHDFYTACDLACWADMNQKQMDFVLNAWSKLEV